MVEGVESLLIAVSNPTRRAILERLAREPHYPLQLSRELNVSQQAIMKHLSLLEEVGIVDSFISASPEGPPRKYYLLKKRFSIRIDVRPDYYNSTIQVFDSEAHAKWVVHSEISDLYSQAKEEKDDRKRLRKLSEAIDRIDARLREVEKEYNDLVHLKEMIQRDAHRIVAQMVSNYQVRSVLYCLIEDRITSLDEMSEMLDMRIKVLREIMSQLEGDLFGPGFIERLKYKKIL